MNSRSIITVGMMPRILPLDNFESMNNLPGWFNENEMRCQLISMYKNTCKLE